eukprot:TRINITY_DN26992_c0_g1_i1.p1 TRINITY_DN26992_c0_g1~~TRINITY_DN26992_c0_g1_i1.p1  ORF type:complete len:387 (+),score=85.26 TRINITY_DN26992_c0_g1_i1:34-1194(+)
MDDYPSDAMTSPPPDMGALGMMTPQDRTVEEEPEPEAGLEELISDDLEQDNVEERLAALHTEIGEAVTQQDFARAWRLQKEVEMTEQLKIKLSAFDDKIAAAIRGMHEAASSQRYIEAEQFKEEIEAVKAHKREVTSVETQIAKLEIQSLVHATNPDGGLQAALGVKSQIEGLSKRREVILEKEAKLAAARANLRHAVSMKEYARAETLKNELSALKGSELVAPPPNSLASNTNVPQNPDSFSPVFSQPSQQPVPPAPHVATRSDDVVTNLATLIWQTSQKDEQNPFLPQQTGDNREEHMRFKRRLLNFYQKYNPSKLPSVTSCLEEYKGHEERLFAALIEKYGPEPPDLMSLPLPPGWRLVESSSGDVFYIHSSGKKQWERPPYS